MKSLVDSVYLNCPFLSNKINKINMINGVSRSNAFELANSRYWHIKRLEQISGSKSPLLNIYPGS